MAKRCVLEKKLLLTAFRKSYMRNRLVPKMNDLDLRLQVVQGHVNHCVTFDVEQGISETVDRDSVPKDDQYEMTYRVSWSRDR